MRGGGDAVGRLLELDSGGVGEDVSVTVPLLVGKSLDVVKHCSGENEILMNFSEHAFFPPKHWLPPSECFGSFGRRVGKSRG